MLIKNGYFFSICIIMRDNKKLLSAKLFSSSKHSTENGGKEKRQKRGEKTCEK